MEAFTAEAKSSGLTQAQLVALDSMHVAVRDERHRWAPTSGNKAHQMEPMISKRRAYNDALSILTPDQQERAYKRFNAPGYKPPGLGK